MTVPGQGAIQQFRRVVARRFGLHFDDDKLPFLEELLRRRVQAGPRTADAGAYLAFLDADAAATAGGRELGAELARLAEELTVPETYFFRNTDQFRAFTGRCLPERLRIRAEARVPPQLRLLSAGCASGEEAYSLAILLLEQAAGILPTWDVSILGVDINPVVLAKAERARYSPWALRETDAATKARWFRMDGRDAILADSARALVRFERRNLTDDDPSFWWPGSTDVVFCRNVLMYMTPQAARAVMGRISRILVPGGYLFLGHAETLRGLSQDFHLCHTHGTFYYQRKDEPPAAFWTETSPGAQAFEPRTEPGPDFNLVSAVDGADSWIEGIRLASERIQALTERAPPDPGAGNGARAATPPASAHRPPSIAPGLELLRSERFADGVAFVRSLPPESASHPEVMLLHAVLLTHAGRLDEAQALCLDLLRADDLDAGAHYVLALCREAAGDPSGAEEHDRAAAYLDGAFAMPRLHLGLLARRRGELAVARRELTEALSLLQREDPARILLFGGGFGREALVALCRAELTASEDHR